MKFIKFLVVTAIVIGGGLFGAKFYAEKNSGELAGVLDQLNPLVKEGMCMLKQRKPIALMAMELLVIRK